MSSAAVANASKGSKSGAAKEAGGKQWQQSNSSSKQDKPSATQSPSQQSVRKAQQHQQPKQQQQQHPLNRRWTLWYDSPSTYNTENWELSLLPIMTVASVEDFFVMLRYMKPLHDLRTSSQYHFFHEGAKPMWEDPANKDGGKIWVNIDIPTSSPGSAGATPGEEKATGTPPTPKSAGKSDLDTMWERVLMALVGEYLEPSVDADAKEGGSARPQIVGVVMAKRKYHNRLALWVRDAGNSAAIETIKKKLKEEASLPASAALVFTKHGEGNGKS